MTQKYKSLQTEKQQITKTKNKNRGRYVHRNGKNVLLRKQHPSYRQQVQYGNVAIRHESHRGPIKTIKTWAISCNSTNYHDVHVKM